MINKEVEVTTTKEVVVTHYLESYYNAITVLEIITHYTTPLLKWSLDYS